MNLTETRVLIFKRPTDYCMELLGCKMHLTTTKKRIKK